ncbi:MAG: GNAT family N-acetyltransferase [Acidobacteriota bacterium]
MSMRDDLSVEKVDDEAAWRDSLTVLESVYQGEKGWIQSTEDFFPAADLGSERVSWFLARLSGEPVGLLRVLYEIPFALYEEYQFELVDSSIDVEAFVRDNRIAEIGRFAVVPEHRKKILVAAILMRAAATETVERNFTHFITDVFEGDPNSPFDFHRRILGFQIVATHDAGELHTQFRRITMLLDLREALLRLRSGNNWIFRYITQGWSDKIWQQLSA